ncbi:hypothetical protein ACIBFB_06975 [Nocardiopsis sp. NPDC050513]|uniref:hypothetical protein n=1 Tax=Nocardiopsis sp. NPDC050513 TaxID=3364338 RepID=UPI0037A75A16
MIHLVLNILFAIVVFLVPGAVALVRAAGSPSGRGLVFTGGGLLILSGLVNVGWAIWYFSLIVEPFGNTVAGGPLPYTGLINAYNTVRPVLVSIAVALLLFAVLSARGKVQPSAGTPTPHGHPPYQSAPGYHAAPGHPGQPYTQQAPAPPANHGHQPPQPPQAPRPEQR